MNSFVTVIQMIMIHNALSNGWTVFKHNNDIIFSKSIMEIDANHSLDEFIYNSITTNFGSI